MSFIQREIDNIRMLLLSGDHPRHDELYAAQQALEWAQEPTGIKSPYVMLCGAETAPVGHLGAIQPGPDRFPLKAS